MQAHDQIEILPGHKTEPWKFLDNAANRLGFSAVGTIGASPLPSSVLNRYRQWLENGYNSDMAYMRQNDVIRQNPGHEKLLKNATTIITVAMSYGRGISNDGFWKYVSRHARGRDYHRTLKMRLLHLAKEVQTHFPMVKYRPFVDSAPIMERTLAMLSGIGTIGKNGAVLVKNVGPAVVLGELICSGVPYPSSPPPPAPPFERCGSCSKCIDACPTGAIVSPGTVNAQRCLSYWTIESKSNQIPKPFSSALSKIYGCDICTDVCPLVKATPSMLEPVPSRRPFPATLERFAEMDSSSLKEMLSGTSLYRTGVARLKRNIRHFLENGRTP